MRLRTKAQRFAEILEGVPDLGDAPDDLLRRLRGGQHQTPIAAKARISQGYYSELESGKKPLTPAVAEKLGPVLGIAPDALMTAHRVASLKAMADGGRLDPESLFRAVRDLSRTLPDADLSDSLVDVLLGVLKKALETYDAYEAAAAKASTKSAATERTRDGVGRRIGHDEATVATKGGGETMISLSMRRDAIAEYLRRQRAEPIREAIRRLEDEREHLLEDERRARIEPSPEVPQHLRGSMTPSGLKQARIGQIARAGAQVGVELKAKKAELRQILGGE